MIGHLLSTVGDSIYISIKETRAETRPTVSLGDDVSSSVTHCNANVGAEVFVEAKVIRRKRQREILGMSQHSEVTVELIVAPRGESTEVCSRRRHARVSRFV